MGAKNKLYTIEKNFGLAPLAHSLVLGHQERMEGVEIWVYNSKKRLIIDKFLGSLRSPVTYL